MTLARNRRFDDEQPTISEVMVIDAGCVPRLYPHASESIDESSDPHRMDRIGRE